MHPNNLRTVTASKGISWLQPSSIVPNKKSYGRLASFRIPVPLRPKREPIVRGDTMMDVDVPRILSEASAM